MGIFVKFIVIFNCRFPFLDTERRNKWFQNLGIHQVPTRVIFLCSDHFNDDDFYYTPQGRKMLYKHAVPINVSERIINPVTIFSPSSSATKTASEAETFRFLSKRFVFTQIGSTYT